MATLKGFLVLQNNLTRLSLDEAIGIVERARVHARGIGLAVVITVVDSGGHLVALMRMDDAILGSIDFEITKAKTSILFNGPSEGLWAYCGPGGPAPATEFSNGGLIPYAGGVAFRNADGSLRGAIGVSGGLPEQDGLIARAGLYSTVASEAVVRADKTEDIT